jgi:hypothetical protein
MDITTEKTFFNVSQKKSANVLPQSNPGGTPRKAQDK